MTPSRALALATASLAAGGALVVAGASPAGADEPVSAAVDRAYCIVDPVTVSWRNVSVTTPKIVIPC